MPFPMVNLEKFLIPLEEIKSATEEFQKKNEIARSEYSKLYRGQLSESWENRIATFKRFGDNRCENPTAAFEKEFHNELKVISNLNHENIVPFLGYCNEGEYRIIVYGYPVNGSLFDHLIKDPAKRSCLTWQHRLEICMGAARGLRYLHSGLGQCNTVIHGSFRDKNILLDDHLKAKICGFEISEFIPGNQVCQQVYVEDRECSDMEDSDMEDSDIEDMKMGHHKDPIYIETGFLKAESDIYSFGVLLFRILTWPQAFAKLSKDGDRMPKSLTMKVQHYYDNRLDWLIDPAIRDQIGGTSFRMVEEITCKCLSYNIKDRPTMDTVVKSIEDALVIHNQEAIFLKGIRGEYRNLRELFIPSMEIELAMEVAEVISQRIDGELLTAELSERWPNRKVVIKSYVWTSDEVVRHMFYNELNMVSRFHHENILPYIGYCDEGGYMVLIYEHAINGSLCDYLHDPEMLHCLPWEQRLKICLGAAKGLKCLHSGLLDENRIVVHRHFRSQYILLDENMEAKISEFSLSTLVTRNKPRVCDYNIWENEDCSATFHFRKSMDPIYKQSYIVNTEVDVYSFGLVMFEILSGIVEASPRSFKRWIHRHYCDNKMDELIDSKITDQIDGRCLQLFAETAYKCLSYNIKERPSMNRIVKKIEEALYFQKNRATAATIIITQSLQYEKLEALLIPLKEINLATSDFSKTFEIGKGGFGVVYKGRLSEHRKNHEVAIKRLDKTGYQGKKEFLNELKLISKFHHQNIIPFIGYCDEGEEMILVYEYAKKGSLDYHLEDKNRRRCLTWVKRLKICLGAAKGLEYLHTGLGEESRVIHRDVKSSNILLDEKMEAKICDFGLSKSDTSKMQQTRLYTNAAGTNYYMDPIYHEGGILRPESDVYSFGVVMFEMLSGMLAWYRRKIGDGKPRPLINLVRRYYDYGKELLIDPQIKDHIDNSSFLTFIETAYQCISFNSKERPTMEAIVDKIDEALDFQVKKEVSS